LVEPQARELLAIFENIIPLGCCKALSGSSSSPTPSNIGADLGAMGDALTLLIGGPPLIYVILFGTFCAILQIFMGYGRYVAVLKWLTLALFGYFGTIMVRENSVDGGGPRLLCSNLDLERRLLDDRSRDPWHDYQSLLVFLAGLQEVEDIRATPERKPLVRRRGKGRMPSSASGLILISEWRISNIVALAIIVTTAATLHANGVVDIETSGQAAEALRPVAVHSAFALFALGLSAPIVGRSCIGGIGCLRGGRGAEMAFGLARRPSRPKHFTGP